MMSIALMKGMCDILMGMENREDPAKNAVNTDFLTEKIKRRPINRRKLLRQLLVTAALAVVFGIVACISFLVLEPRVSALLYGEVPAESIQLPEERPDEEMSPQDMMTAADEKQVLQNEIQQELQQGLQEEIQKTAASAAETVIPEVTQSITANVTESVTESLTAKMNAMVAEAISGSSSNEVNIKHLREIYDSLMVVASQASRSLVIVTGSRESRSWLDSYETYTSVAGIITHMTSQEILIFCQGEALADADRITVTFTDEEGSEARAVEAAVTGSEPASGYCMLSVKPEELSADMLRYIRTCRLGESSSPSQAGYPVIAAGAPAGGFGSVSYGVLSGVSGRLDLADSDYIKLSTDIYTNTDASGVVIDTAGRILGIIDMRFNEKGLENQLCAIGIDELKTTIKRFAEGYRKPYLGIHGTDFVLPDRTQNAAGTAEDDSDRVPEEENGTDSENVKGVYVTALDMDSPAMAAGLRNADVIVAVNSTPTASMEAVIDAFWDWDENDPLLIEVMRSSGSSYAPVTIEVMPETAEEYLDLKEEQ